MKEPVVIDAQYRDLGERFRLPWRSLLLLFVVACGLAVTAVEMNDPAVSGVLVLAAAFLWPIWRALSLAAAPQLSEQTAQQLRQRLAGGWDQAEAQRARQAAAAAARRVSRLP